MADLTCPICGRSFRVKEVTNKRGKFCSSKCFGAFRRSKAIEDRFWPKVRKTSKCWLWTGGTAKGYGTISFKCMGKRTIKSAHRVSWELHFGEIPDGLYVLHRCDNPPCVNPAHLFLGTHLENIADMLHKNRQIRGERAGSHALTTSDVVEIRRRYAAGGISMDSLATEHGVVIATIYNVIRRKTWTHVA